MADPPRSAAVLPTHDPLLAEYWAGTPGATDRLVAAYAPVVRAAIARYLALRRRGHSELADDLTHEVFIGLLRDEGRKLRGFQGRNGCSFAGWLRVVAVRRAIDALRRERRLVSLDDDSSSALELRRQLRSDVAGPEETAQASETAARLTEALRQLAAKDRLLVELHIVRGVSLQEVAVVLGVTANAAYVRKSRVLDRLRQHLEEHT